MGSTNDSTRANRLRLRIKAGSRVAPADIAWLTQYEASRKNDGHGSQGAHGRSAAKSRRVSYTEEETAQAAEGTGDAAASMAAAAMMTRAEGERLDSILKIGVSALKEAVEAYKSMCESLLAERQADAQTHRALLESLRTHFLERAEAESELVRQQAEHEAARLREQTAEDGLDSAIRQAVVQKLTGLDTVPVDTSAKAKKA